MILRPFPRREGLFRFGDTERPAPVLVPQFLTEILAILGQDIESQKVRFSGKPTLKEEKDMGVRNVSIMLLLALTALMPLAAGGSQEQSDPDSGGAVLISDHQEPEEASDETPMEADPQESPEEQPPAEPAPEDPEDPPAPPEEQPPTEPAPDDPPELPDVEPPADPLPEDPPAPPEEQPPGEPAPEDPDDPAQEPTPEDPEDPPAPPEEQPPVEPDPEDPDDPAEEPTPAEPTIVVQQETTVEVIAQHEQTTVAHELFSEKIAEMMEREPRVAVFVPADEAFEEIDREELTEEERRELFERHVAIGDITEAEIEEVDSFETARGRRVAVTREPDGTVVLDGRVVVVETVRTRDGVVYVIDRTIDDPEEPGTGELSVLDVIAGHEMTSIAYDLFGEEFAAALADRPRLAFFVPADEAIADLDPDTLSDAEIATLAERHVAIGLVSAEPIEFVESFVTTDGEIITVFVENDGTVILNGSVVVMEAIPAVDGYVYIIDGLLDDGEIVS